MITIFHAIQSLVPGAEVSVGMYDKTVTWHRPGTAPVTLEQILQEQRRLQQAYDWDEYQRNRAREYPTVQEQLDALYHAGVFPPEMAARIQAVKEKYPRGLSEQTQTKKQPTPTTTVEAWLAEQTKPPRFRRITQQSAPTMTREEWLAEQTKIPVNQQVTQQPPPQSSAPMTREEWLASQVEVKTTHNTTPTGTVTVTRTMTADEWLREQASLVNSQTMTREQWLEQQKLQDQPRKLTREEWLAEQANVGN